MRLPRLMVAAPATGQGKTTVATGLMAALARAGHEVSGHKVGPDYIDPGYHALACGRPGRNLDAHLVGEELIVPLLLHGALTPRPADVAIVEGVMGLFDGRIGGDGFSSTAHVAALTRTPVVLVVDISRSSRTIGAVVHGLATWDPSIEVAGVILNKVGSARHAAEVASSISLPILGSLPRDARIEAPSRHLGLVPADERELSSAALDRLAMQVTEHVDLDAVLALAATAPDLDADPWDPAAEVARPQLEVRAQRPEVEVRAQRPEVEVRAQRPEVEVRAQRATRPPAPERPVVAMAGGRAFTFRYPETEELLRAAGCDVVTFDPLTDPDLPPGTAGLYLGGGFPEVHVAELAANDRLLKAVRDAVEGGLPTVAECAGLLYLCSTLDPSTGSGQAAAMADVVPAAAAMTERLTLRYPHAHAASDSFMLRAGETVTGHEFHRTQVDPVAGAWPAWIIDGRAYGTVSPFLHASYLHVHWAGYPVLAQRFADAVHAHA